MKQTVSILLRNQEDALIRLLGVLYRRGYPVESLTVVPDRQQDHVRITATVYCGQPESSQLLRYIAKLIDVVTAEIQSAGNLTAHEVG